MHRTLLGAIRCGLTVAVMTLGLSLEAQPAADAWTPFLGQWRGPGMAMGAPATGDAQWAMVLGGRYVRLEMSFTPRGAAAPAFFGHAYYSTRDSVGLWVDSQGTRYDLRYGIRGDTLLVRYTLLNGTPAESRYVKIGVDSLMERSATLRADGRWVEFLSYRFSRVTSTP